MRGSWQPRRRAVAAVIFGSLAENDRKPPFDLVKACFWPPPRPRRCCHFRFRVRSRHSHPKTENDRCSPSSDRIFTATADPKMTLIFGRPRFIFCLPPPFKGGKNENENNNDADQRRGGGELTPSASARLCSERRCSGRRWEGSRPAASPHPPKPRAVLPDRTAKPLNPFPHSHNDCPAPAFWLFTAVEYE